jgi:hypothetical protein
VTAVVPEHPASPALHEASSHAVGGCEAAVRARVGSPRNLPSARASRRTSPAEAPGDQAAVHSSASKDARTRCSAVVCASWNGRRPVSATPVS